MIVVGDMKLAGYTLGVVLLYTLIAVLAPPAAVAVTLPCCCALILPCVVHLRRRAARRAKRGTR